MGPLHGIRVLELSEGLAGQFAGKLLADWGATVVQLVRSDANRPYSDAHDVWSLGKRQMGFTPTELQAQGASADVLLLEDDGHWDLSSLPANPGLVCSVVSDSAADGVGSTSMDVLHARVGLLHTHLTAADETRPVFHVSPASAYGAGWLAALGALVGLRQIRHGVASPQVTTSHLQGALSMIQYSLALPAESPSSGVISNDGDPFRITTPALRFYKARDERWVLVGAVTPQMWVKMCVALERTDLLVDPELAEAPWGVPTREARLRMLQQISRTIAEWDSEKLVEHLNADRVIAAPSLRSAEFLEDELAKSEGIIAASVRADGAELRHVTCPVTFHGPETDPIAALGQPTLVGDASASQPLQGVRVLDFASFVAAPAASKHLADLGASVLKVEPPSGDGLRQVGYSFSAVNFGKDFVTCDLTSESGRAKAEELIRNTDIVVHNFGPKLQQRTGMTYERIASLNPQAVVAQLNGWANEGNFADRPAVDGAFQAYTGACTNQGGGVEPRGYYGGLVDNSAGLVLASACLAGLYERETTGRGQLLTTTLLRIAASIQSHRLVSVEGRMLEGPSFGPDPIGRSQICRAFQASDGWIFLDATGDSAWQALRDSYGLSDEDRPSDTEDSSTIESGPIAALLASAVQRCTSAEIVGKLTQIGVDAARVRRMGELPQDSDIVDSGLLALVDHPEWGRLWQTGELIRLTNPSPVGSSGPRTSQGNPA